MMGPGSAVQGLVSSLQCAMRGAQRMATAERSHKRERLHSIGIPRYVGRSNLGPSSCSALAVVD